VFCFSSLPMTLILTYLVAFAVPANYIVSELIEQVFCPDNNSANTNTETTLMVNRLPYVDIFGQNVDCVSLLWVLLLPLRMKVAQHCLLYKYLIYSAYAIYYDLLQFLFYVRLTVNISMFKLDAYILETLFITITANVTFVTIFKLST
ncbi:hypothetical protein ALC57_06139, partial [Trachymyrmex cornetzi]